MAGTLPSKSPTVVFQEMDEGGVLFCTRTEVYFGVNEVGRHIWDRLPNAGQSGSFEELQGALQVVYPDAEVPVLSADIREFLDALEQAELVAHAQSEESSS